MIELTVGTAGDGRRRTGRVRGRADNGQAGTGALAGTGRFSTTGLSDAEIRRWLKRQINVADTDEERLLQWASGLLARQRQWLERARAEDVDATVAGLMRRIEWLQRQVSTQETTLSNVTQYFERLVEHLLVRASLDPKTELMNFGRFRARLEMYLTVERRGRWCAVGLADVNRFKWYNDTLGHEVGDRILQRLAMLLQRHVRTNDLVAHDASTDLHARFGGDEFCFLVANLDDWSTGVAIADRFREAVRNHDWCSEHERLAEHPVVIDVGVACLQMDSVSVRRGLGAQLATQLLSHADKLMYEAKFHAADRVLPRLLRIEGESLVPIHPTI